MVESATKIANPEEEGKLVRMKKEEIEAFEGYYNSDGFFLLKDGGFFDCNGYRFDKDGYDGLGGFYDEDGYYVTPQKAKQINQDGRSTLLKKHTKEEIEQSKGDYDEDGFYILEEGKLGDGEGAKEQDGGYFDPLGYFFDKDGFDAVGGQYDKEGYYIRPAQENFGGYYFDDLEDYDLNDDEEDQEQGTDALEKEAMMQEHVMPAQLYVKTELAKDPNKNFYIRVKNLPELYEEKNILKFLKKKIPDFNFSKLVMESRPQRSKKAKENFSGSVLI